VRLAFYDEMYCTHNSDRRRAITGQSGKKHMPIANTTGIRHHSKAKYVADSTVAHWLLQNV